MAGTRRKPGGARKRGPARKTASVGPTVAKKRGSSATPRSTTAKRRSPGTVRTTKKLTPAAESKRNEAARTRPPRRPQGATLAIKPAATRDLLAQRETELALINSIQGGLAARLDFQAIVDRVGDKLRVVFRTPDLSITWLDEKTNLIHVLYVYEHGQRLRVAPLSPTPGGIYETMRRTLAPLVLGRAADYARFNMKVVPGTDQSRSMICVPVLSGGKLVGDISIENYERENAFGPSDVQVLTSVAASLGVALVNAHLFDETQRLLKETEQRNAELAVINSIQQGVAAELDFKTIVDLVGDKLREVLKTGDIGIRWYDYTGKLIHYLYEYEHGRRLPPVAPAPPRTLPWETLTAIREARVMNTIAESASVGTLPGTDTAKSGVVVPIVGSDRVIGSIAVENHEREHAFAESDVRLLMTVASSMGVALENARLFDETQRLMKETEQRKPKSTLINTMHM
jgi:GAF domain-containing protein